MEDLTTGHGQLWVPSEYRFVYWPPETRYYTAVLGKGHADGLWAVCDTDRFGACWTGEKWSFDCRGLDAFRYDLEGALDVAKQLAIEKNQHIIEIMEKKFPGEFRGGKHDLAAKNVREQAVTAD